MASRRSPPHSNFNFKRIADPVHGTIGLSKLEVRIINGASVFKRLRHVKQLGLAHFVFPGADYSRFSHSIGVCHVTGRILGSLRRTGVVISNREIQLYRLAGLFHDLGHYPFSHTMEDALKDAWSKRSIASKGEPVLPLTGQNEEPPFEHEPLGVRILEHDSELGEIFEQFGDGITPQDVGEILSKTNPRITLGTLISSDLDADRIDYLLRNSHHTGLPYGSIDMNHILSEMRLDKAGRLCLRPKALRTADHLFLGRYFDYQQIAFNKTVKAAELVLQDVIAELIEHNLIDVSRASIIKKIDDQTWCDFDDGHISEKIRELRTLRGTDESLRIKAESILFRRPPKLVAEMEFILHLAEDQEQSAEFFQSKLDRVNDKLSSWVADFSINRTMWYLWIKRGIRLTKVGSVKMLDDEGAELDGGNHGKEGSELTRILIGNESKPIVTMPYSIMSVMSNYGFYALRIYVLFPKESEKLRGDIYDRIQKDIPSKYWKLLGPTDTSD